MAQPASSILLAPLSAIYGLATRARLALYESGALKVERVTAPVISVGNLTAGGTGKTPLVAWLARAVAREGKRPCILTRGYGRTDPKSRVLVSDGERVLVDAREGGDEPFMLAHMLKGIAAVISDADRASAARWAIENLRSEVFILDDGFQHLRLARDLNILTLDATNPWGGAHLLPRGTLRESLAGLARADCIVITRADQSSDAATLRLEATRLSGGRPVLLSRTQVRDMRPLFAGTEPVTENATKSSMENSMKSTLDQKINFPDQKMSSLDRNTGSLAQPVAAFCAIGNPRAFFDRIRRESIALAHTRAFPDHHVYTQKEVDALAREAVERGARALLTTAKDAVKLRSLNLRLPCFVLEVELVLDEEGTLLDLLREALKSGAAS